MRLAAVKTYDDDGRMPIEKVYSSIDSLRDCGWLRDFVCYTSAELGGKSVDLPVYCYRTRHKGKSHYLMAPPHGEEPVFTNAAASSEGLKLLEEIGKENPVVLFPLCNPTGYVRNWRYLDLPNYSANIYNYSSIGDPEHFLPVIDSLGRVMPRHCRKKPSPEAIAFTGHIIKLSRNYRPEMMLSFHEDNEPRLKYGYAYSHGELKRKEHVALNIIRILTENGLSSYNARKREFSTKGAERIYMTSSNSSCDYSVESLFSSDVMISSRKRGEIKICEGLKTRIVVACEIPSANHSLEKRVKGVISILKEIKSGSIFTLI